MVDGERVQATTARTATATTATARDWKTCFYKRPTGPMYPSMGLPGGENGSAVITRVRYFLLSQKYFLLSEYTYSTVFYPYSTRILHISQN